VVAVGTGSSSPPKLGNSVAKLKTDSMHVNNKESIRVSVGKKWRSLRKASLSQNKQGKMREGPEK